MRLRAYIDDSIKDDVLVMAGYIASTDSWDKFTYAWQQRLEELRLDEFKMSQRVNSPIEFNSYFYRLIEQYVLCAICVGVPITTLQKVVCEYGLPQETANHYGWAIKSIVNLFAQNQDEIGIHEPVDFVFDEQNNVSKEVLQAWSTYTGTIPARLRELTGAKPTFENSHRILPLQAADMIAYWYRDRFNKSGSFHDRSFPFPWKTKRDYTRLLFWHSEETLRVELANLRERHFSHLIRSNGFGYTFRIGI